MYDLSRFYTTQKEIIYFQRMTRSGKAQDAAICTAGKPAGTRHFAHSKRKHQALYLKENP